MPPTHYIGKTETKETLYSLAMKIFFAEKDSNNLKLINEAKEQFDREEKFKKFFSTRKIH
jgi:hypothetical protein